jgi:hypothetical protein
MTALPLDDEVKKYPQKTSGEKNVMSAPQAVMKRPAA